MIQARDMVAEIEDAWPKSWPRPRRPIKPAAVIGQERVVDLTLTAAC